MIGQMLAFIPDMIQGSIQGVIRALDVQRKASYMALAAFYLVSIPLACVLVFVSDMGVAGLWFGMAAGITIQAISYTHLVVYQTNWQEVADEAEKRIASDQAAMQENSFTSIQSYGSYSSSRSNSYYLN